MRRGEVRIEGLSKRYWFRSRAPGEENADAQENDDEGEEEAEASFASLFGRRAEIWALRDIFCHITPGQRVAVIGANGAGKTTLIRILAQTLPPSEGTVEGAGTVMPFDAMTDSISDQQSGCDNLRILARLLGFSLEHLEQRLPEIIEFSELGSLAHEKVFRYSKKSFGRLGMAMALCIDADTYLIDDSFGAGDEIYQRKVKDKFREVLDTNRTLIFASNKLRELKLYCQRALWLDGGKLVADGDFDMVAEGYLASSTRRMSQADMDPEQDSEASADSSDLESSAMVGRARPVTVLDDQMRALKRAKQAK